MDEELADCIMKTNHEDETGEKSASSEENPESLKSSMVLKHKMPDLLTCPQKYMKTNVGTKKHIDVSLLFPNPDCFILEQEGEPPLAIPLNVEGDRIVNKLFDRAVEEYLSFKVDGLGVRAKYSWMDRWAVLRYKQPGTTPKLSKCDASSLDETLNDDSDSDHELVLRSNTSHPDFTHQVRQTDFPRPDPPTRSISSIVQRGHSRRNELAPVRPRINFYNALSEDFNVEQTAPIRPSEKTNENGTSPRLLVESGSEATSGQVPEMNSTWTFAKGASCAKTPLQKTVSWCPELVSQQRRATEESTTNRKSFGEDQFDEDDDVLVCQSPCLSIRRRYMHRSVNQCDFTDDESWTSQGALGCCSGRAHIRLAETSDTDDSFSSFEDCSYASYNCWRTFGDSDSPDDCYHR